MPVIIYVYVCADVPVPDFHPDDIYPYNLLTVSPAGFRDCVNFYIDRRPGIFNHPVIFSVARNAKEC